jgi:ABC-2 type transport system ATP-binding protein
MNPDAIRLTDLTKYYGDVVGVDGLSLSVPQGEIFGFLGANGAGKTTTLRILLDLLRPTRGSATVLGFDAQRHSRDVRRRIGYLPGEMPIYGELTGAGYLKYLDALSETRASSSRVRELLRRFDVSDLDLTRRMRDYSHGMKRKLGIVQALMSDAPVVILDEPTSGLDPLMIGAFSQTIDDLARSGRTTVFLSSHVLSEVERICRRVALVRSGRLVAVRTVTDLRASSTRRVTVRFSQPVAAKPPASGSLVVHQPDCWVMDVDGPLGGLVQQLAGLPVADITTTTPTIEDTILRLMNEDCA